MSEPLFSSNSGSENTDPSIAVNFVTNKRDILRLDNGYRYSEILVTLEIVMKNFEPNQVLNFFNSSTGFIDDCANKTIAMYDSLNLSKMNQVPGTPPQVNLVFSRTPKASGLNVDDTTVEEQNLAHRFFLSNIGIQITACELVRIKQCFAQAVASITAQINDAVSLYNTSPTE